MRRTLWAGGLVACLGIPLALTQVVGASATTDADLAFGPIERLYGLSTLREAQSAGYLPGSSDGNVQLFFWLFEAREQKADAPVVVWLNGGPFVSSLVGALAEVGPYRPIKSDDGTWQLEDAAAPWNRRAHLLCIDQPVGTGLSYTKGSRPRTNASTATEQLLYALRAFYDQRQDLRDRPLYLFGESFAGHYIPSLVAKIHAEGERQVAGIGLGNPWVDPASHIKSQPGFANENGLITASSEFTFARYKSWADRIASYLPTLKALANAGKLERSLAGKQSPFDIDRTNEPLRFPNAKAWIQEARQDLHAAESPDGPPPWLWRSSLDDLAFDEAKSTADLFVPLLEAGVRVLVYSGNRDLDVNIDGTKQWLNALGFSGFQTQPDEPWPVTTDGTTNQLLRRTAGGTAAAPALTLVQFPQSGHMVPKDAPKAARTMLEWFIQR